MQVWMAEQQGLNLRPLILQLQPQQETQQISFYCKVCFLILSSAESFYKHCSSVEHAQLLRQDTSVWWRKRPPPHSRRAEFWLCDRPESCEYGGKCPKAHSKEELQEWIMRTEEVDEIRQNIEAEGLMSYNERLLQEYRSCSNEVHIMSEYVDDVSISSDEDLTLYCDQVHTKLQWNFTVETERALEHVALLKQEPGACFSLEDGTICIYSSGPSFYTDNTTYTIPVCFTSDVPGLYEQWLVLEFDIRPVLLKKLRVVVGQRSTDDYEETAVNAAVAQTLERWHSGNRLIVHCINRTEEQEELLKRYKPPQINFQFKPALNLHTELSHENYKEQMHHFLYSEERAEDRAVSKLNISGEMRVKDHITLWGTGERELFGEISLPFSLTAGTAEGLALRRSIHSALIAPASSTANSKVYEAIIVQDKTSENVLYLKLSKRCCSELALKRNTSLEMEVQFQLNRYHFCSLHKAVDLLPDTSRVLPDLENCTVPTNNNQFDKLNAKQQEAVRFMMGKADNQKCVAPLLIYGPFGTGKTFTLATAAMEMCQQPNNKVLICTHTNSSADLYVRDHFHKTDANIRPLRVKANTDRGLWATDEITLKFCFLNEDKSKFLPPTKAKLDQHNVIVVTTTMARQLHDLKLPEGYFSHILIDEASQMLECEALSALGLAGAKTRVALAGDHMQLGPKLFSVEDHKRSDHTLLTRLFHFYQIHKGESARRSRIILSDNYRSTREIVDFVSAHFYSGKGDVIKSTEEVPPPPNGHALRFSHVRGECRLDRETGTWYNSEEADRVVEAVKDLLRDWPSSWGPQSICVLSEGFQVKQIRRKMSNQGLNEVNVLNLANVQGLQFRVVIISAVHSCDSLKALSCPELFNDYIWTKIQAAAEAGDTDRLVDLIAADDIHPQLRPLTTQFRKCLNKAYYIRSLSSQSAEVGHYSLQLQSYTQASSPIRRYIDIVLQRLLHCSILKSQVPFTREEISSLCTDYDQNAKNARDAKTEQMPPQTTVYSGKIEHVVEISLLLKPGNTLRVQMTCEVHRGYWRPAIQLVCR
uniref:C3H1-type domain-containing protein n=1 Tax=Knipowitschia caucasica TaxID=637954 RepID=A0AAV2M6C6_KNICA